MWADKPKRKPKVLPDARFAQLAALVGLAVVGILASLISARRPITGNYTEPTRQLETQTMAALLESHRSANPDWQECIVATDAFIDSAYEPTMQPVLARAIPGAGFDTGMYGTLCTVAEADGNLYPNFGVHALVHSITIPASDLSSAEALGDRLLTALRQLDSANFLTETDEHYTTWVDIQFVAGSDRVHFRLSAQQAQAILLLNLNGKNLIDALLS